MPTGIEPSAARAKHHHLKEEIRRNPELSRKIVTQPVRLPRNVAGQQRRGLGAPGAVRRGR